MHEVQISKPSGKEPGRWENIRILVVDDEESVCESMKMILGIKDYEVVTVFSGFEAVEAIKKSEFDVVLTDIRMPGMDGLEVLKRVKEYDSDIEVIIVTAYPSLDNSIEAMRLGAMDFLTKPFLMEQVYQMVDRAFRRRKENLKKKECLIAAQTGAKTDLPSSPNLLSQKIIEAGQAASGYEALIKEIIKIIANSIPYHILTIYLPETREVFVDLRQNLKRGFLNKISAKTLEHAAEYGAPAVSADSAALRIETNNFMIEEGEFQKEIPTFVATPLKSGSALVALLAISSPEKDAYSRAVLDAFTSIPDSAAIVIENALLKRGK